ncbi:MAG TPA: hypothetical protein VHP33_25780 [Polyangiaceae bacterium]|nr:hypothetical protein [Polyangiaceae bacterium]
MTKQQLALRALALATALSIGSAYAGDGPAGSAPAGKGKPPPGDARPDKGEHGRPGKLGNLGPEKHDHAADAPDKAANKDKGPDKDKAREGRGPGRHGMHELFAELKSGKLSKGDLKERLSELREHREDRAKAHREELKARHGAALASPAARQELEHHARRMARLNRAMVLAETEVVKDKDKLKERVQKLLDKENARHQAAMDRFKVGAPAGSAAASAAPEAPPAPVAVEKGADK